jgi:hypothetical protein
MLTCLDSTVFSIGNAISADYFNERCWHIAVPATIGGIFYILLAAVLNPKARYVFMCFGAAGGASSLLSVERFA